MVLRGEMKLIIEDDEGHKTTVPFVRDEITVGREEGNTIRLTERNVSRRHARFFKHSGQIYVEDLKSFNGIKVNGDRIEGRTSLKEGDLIQIGDFDLAVQGEQGPTLSNGRAAQATEQMPALEVDTVNMPAPDVDRDPSRPAAPAPRAQATSVIRVPLSDAELGQGAPPAPAAEDVSPDEAPRLVIVSTELAGREFACIRSVLTLGRGDECDIVINHRSLSRAHCRLERDRGGTWKVVDLGSSNRTQVNGEEYAESALRGGDVIGLGHVKLRFVAPGEDYTYASEGSGGGKRSALPMVVGAALGLVLLGGASVYFLMHGHKKAAAPEGNPPQPVASTAGEKPAAAAPEATPKPAAAVAEPATTGKPEPVAATPPPEKTPVAEVKPPEPKPAPEVKPAAPDEVKVPAVDPDEQKLTDAVNQAEQKLTKQRDPEGALAILEKVKSIAVGNPEYEKWQNQLNAEVRYHALVEDGENAAKSGTPGLDLLNELREVPEKSVFYKQAQGLVRRFYDKAVKAQAKAQAKEKKAAAATVPAVAKAVPPPVLPANPTDDKAKRALELRKQGLDLLAAGDTEGALPMLQKAVNADPDSAENVRALAGCLARLNRFPEAATYYRKFLQLAPNDPAVPTIRKALQEYENPK
jgi:pSer/pThr/pTyr-binding forkhead associated (FHA) protein